MAETKNLSEIVSGEVILDAIIKTTSSKEGTVEIYYPISEGGEYILIDFEANSFISVADQLKRIMQEHELVKK